MAEMVEQALMGRTRAERRVDELAAEARRLRTIPANTRSQAEHRRLRHIVVVELPAAWRAVNQMRGGLR
jgi:hypothetical protein